MSDVMELDNVKQEPEAPPREDGVQVLSPQQAEREYRRKRRRKLQRLLQPTAQTVPSFLQFVQMEPNDKDDDDDDILEPPFVVINVDEYLGLTNTIPLETVSDVIPSSSIIPTRTVMPTPAEEGWYEGCRPMSMPEDETYLSDLQQWIRQNLEFFSATSVDVQHSQAGRRTKTVLGKVGIRCKHCARAILPQLQQGRAVSWPPGAVSYPLNFSGLYSVCSQKPQLHFEHCPYLPTDSKMATMVQEENGGKRKRMVQGVSGLMYYIISMQRIGIRELSNGLRFGRDLSLEPLDFKTTRFQVEQERPDLIPRQYKAIAPETVASNPPTASDANSQEVLQQALEQAKQADTEDTKLLIRFHDKVLLTDYMFVAISQMAICHANSSDFMTRGKKTKLMRLGFAGFCCRHCESQTSYSCRSFSSAPDNLASAISNSFVLHLQKCPYTPRPVQTALVTLKRLHSRQMAQLPYGSQRKLFVELWNRMRATDQIVEGKEEEMMQDKNEVDKVVAPVAPAVVPSATVMDSSALGNSRGASFPVSGDEETQRVLREAEEGWDPTDNDNLILPDDRNLVSDYVFLTMRQLKVAMPTVSDFRGNRRNNVIQRMSGMCCVHCANDPNVVTPSGRSFPSAPDNMASALNSSLYNHMQHCPHLPSPIKRAFQHLRKIHSQQCASLVFGSQRRFFNQVFAKLKQIPISEDVVATLRAASAVTGPKPTSRSPPTVMDDNALSQHSFVSGGTIGAPYWQCLRCRMVPFEFRATGAVHYVRPSAEHLKLHISICQGDGIYLGWVLGALKKLKAEYPTAQDHLESLVQLVVGDDKELCRLFVHCDREKAPATGGWWRRLPETVDSGKVQQAFEGIATELGLASTQLRDNPLWLRYLQVVSPYFQCPPEQKPDANMAEKSEAEAKEQGNSESKVDSGPTDKKGQSEVPTTNHPDESPVVPTLDEQ